MAANRKYDADKLINQSQYILMLNKKIIYLSNIYFATKTKDPKRYKKSNNRTIKKLETHKKC